MRVGLIGKEYRSLRPFFFLGVVLLAFEFVELVQQQWDLRPLGVTFRGFESFFVFQFLIAFAVGTGLLIREIDDGSLVFLDGLPLTRARVFCVKTLAATTTLLVYPFSFLLLQLGLHLVGRGSLDADVHLPLLATQFAAFVALTLEGVACGLLLGFLRSLSWMVLALVAICIKVLYDKWPRLLELNPVEALAIHPIGAHVHFSVEGVATQLIVTAACGICAYWLFNTAGAGRGQRLQLQLSRPLISGLVTLGTIGALAGVLAVYIKTGGGTHTKGTDEAAASIAHFTPTASGHAQTLHYTFSYPAQQSESVQPLLLKADAVFEAVATQLDIDGGLPIDVDLSGSENNTEGTAFFDRIRMIFGGADQLAVLAHETTHVFANRLAGGKDERELEKMDAFNEGLARWVERKLYPDQRLSRVEQLQAAVVSQRRMVTAEQLTDLPVLARVADRNLQYPLGAAIIDALVHRYGAGAPKAILKTIGRPEFPRDLHGFELWQAAFQLSGFDLALVFDDYTQQLKIWEGEFSASIANLPRPRGSLVQTDDWAGVQIRMDTPLPAQWHTVVRFRPKDDSPLREYDTERPDKKNIVWESVNKVANDQVCFQPGIGTRGIVIYEAWNCLPLDSAADYESDKDE
jgi:ABC-type transport system involved in multi-copper enzyme maturation permease subunit